MSIDLSFVWENKSLTNIREFVESWTAVEKYACLQTLLGMFPPGIPILLFEEKLRQGMLKTLDGSHLMRRILGRFVTAPSSECLWLCQEMFDCM